MNRLGKHYAVCLTCGGGWESVSPFVRAGRFLYWEVLLLRGKGECQLWFSTNRISDSWHVWNIIDDDLVIINFKNRQGWNGGGRNTASFLSKKVMTHLYINEPLALNVVMVWIYHGIYKKHTKGLYGLSSSIHLCKELFDL